MGEKNILSLRLKVLEKFHREICEKVRFSDLSHHLITSGGFTKEDVFNICILPIHQQMSLCIQKFTEKLQQEHQIEQMKETDLWTVFLRALNAEHSGLTCKLDGELHKLSKRVQPRRLTKDDIGSPLNFRHIRHIGSNASSISPIRRFLSLRSNSSASSYSSVSNSFNENDPDLKAFFVHAGVTELHLRKPNSRRVILDFIERNGGMEAIRQELRLKSTGSSITDEDSPLPSPTSPMDLNESES